MLYKALISFSGLLSMSEGEVKEILNQEIIDDLLGAKYIEPVVDKKDNKPGRKKTPKGE